MFNKEAVRTFSQSQTPCNVSYKYYHQYTSKLLQPVKKTISLDYVDKDSSTTRSSFFYFHTSLETQRRTHTRESTILNVRVFFGADIFAFFTIFCSIQTRQ